MELRRAVIDDAVQISRLVNSLSQYYLNDSQKSLPLWFVKTLEVTEFERRIVSDQFLNLVCLIDKKVVGYIAIKNQDHLYHLFVDSSQHRKGIAKSLWELAREICSIEHCHVRSSIYAIPVYKRFGFNVRSNRQEKDGIWYQQMEL